MTHMTIAFHAPKLHRLDPFGMNGNIIGKTLQGPLVATTHKCNLLQNYASIDPKQFHQFFLRQFLELQCWW